MKKIILLTTVLAAVSIAGASPTLNIYKKVGANWQYHGSIDTLVTSNTAVQHYSYSTSSGHPAGVDLAYDKVNTWIHQKDGDTSNYSLGLIFSIEDNNKGTSVRGPQIVNIEVDDSLGDPGIDLRDDSSDSIQENPDDTFYASLKFYKSKTDGLIIGGLAGNQWKAVISVDQKDGFNTFAITDGAGNEQALSFGDQYMITPTTVPVPAPGAFMLGGIGAVCVGWIKRRRSL